MIAQKEKIEKVIAWKANTARASSPRSARAGSGAVVWLAPQRPAAIALSPPVGPATRLLADRRRGVIPGVGLLPALTLQTNARSFLVASPVPA